MEYRFVIEDQTAGAEGGIPSGASEVFGSGVGTGANTSTGGGGTTFTEGALNRAKYTAVAKGFRSPLNNAVGGLSPYGAAATPAIMLGARALRGGAIGMGAIGGVVAMGAIIGIQVAISRIQKRIARNERRAEERNNADNLRIRAGAVSAATFFTGGYRGVKATTNRS